MELPIHLLDKQIVSAGNLSGNITSDGLEVKAAIRMSLQVSWTGSSPVGTLKVQGSNDNITFADDPEQASPLAISGSSGQALIKIANTSYNYVRVLYTSTSGSGSLNVNLSAKRL